MRPRSRPSARDPVDALATAAPLATRWVERVLAAGDAPLTVTQFLALHAIEHEPLTASELARRAAVSDAALSQLVAVLETAGLVARKPDPADRRRQALALTELGTRSLAAARARLRAELGQPLRPLGPRESVALADLLERLEAALGGSPPPRRPHPPKPPHARERPRSRPDEQATGTR